MLSSFFCGYALTHLPAGVISDRVGGKYTMGLGILIPSVVTFLTPLSIEWGDSTALIVLRVIIGIFQAKLYNYFNYITIFYFN